MGPQAASLLVVRGGLFTVDLNARWCSPFRRRSRLGYRAGGHCKGAAETGRPCQLIFAPRARNGQATADEDHDLAITRAGG